MNYLTHYKQTRGGNYDSCPELADVLAAWHAGEYAGTQQWALDAANRGHGEYIDNVIGLVAAMHHRGLTENDIPTILAIIEPSE